MTNRAPADGYRDRSTGLIVFGSITIMAGALCALLVPLMAYAALDLARTPLPESAGPAPQMSMIALAILMYAALAVALIWLGVGSIQAWRWARALLLVSSWIALVGGVLGLLFAAVFLPAFYGQLVGVAGLPPEAMAMLQVLNAGIMLVFFVLLPGAFVWFYGSPHTRATCERRDPRPRWTDRCPLPVLALSLLAGSVAISLPAMAGNRWALPCFGFMVSGGMGAAVLLVLMAVLAGVAWGLYRLHVAAWWSAVGLLLAWAASAGLTFARLPLAAYYADMGIPEDQLQLILPKLPPLDRWMLAGTALSVWAGLGYLLWVRRYFTRQAKRL